MKRKIIIWLTHKEIDCFRFKSEHKAKVVTALPEFEVVVCADRAEFKRELPGSYAAVVWVFKQEWFVLAPELRWVITPAAGKDYFKVNPPDNVRMHYGHFQGKIMAETVLAMMLASVRGVLPAVNITRERSWPRAELEKVMRPFIGSTVTIVGFGAIGREIGRLAKVCGANIIGVKRNCNIDKPQCFTGSDRIISSDDLDTVLPCTNHLVLSLPGIPETDNIITGKRLALLPEYAVLYNIGRGNAVDENALADALINKKIAGACLDVFKDEPLPDNSVLRTVPNLLIMPHASAISPEYMMLFADELINLMKKNGAS